MFNCCWQIFEILWVRFIEILNNLCPIWAVQFMNFAGRNPTARCTLHFSQGAGSESKAQHLTYQWRHTSYLSRKTFSAQCEFVKVSVERVSNFCTQFFISTHIFWTLGNFSHIFWKLGNISDIIYGVCKVAVYHLELLIFGKGYSCILWQYSSCIGPYGISYMHDSVTYWKSQQLVGLASVWSKSLPSFGEENYDTEASRSYLVVFKETEIHTKANLSGALAKFTIPQFQTLRIHISRTQIYNNNKKS